MQAKKLTEPQMAGLLALAASRPETHAELVEFVALFAAAQARATRPQWERLRACATGDAGLIQRRRNRATRTIVSIFDAAESGLECEAGLDYVLVCDDHGACVGVETIAVARSEATDPRGWCDDCREVPAGGA